MMLLLKIFVLSLTFASTNASDRLEWNLEDALADAVQDEGIPPDDLSHDCKTVLPIDHDDLRKNPILGRFNYVHKRYVKYNHAYGIPVFGVAKFKNESMLRACYLIRYLFAGNEWLRRYGVKSKMYLSGYNGGWCCPPQMGNNGLSCSCEPTKYPFLGKGAPAHEMAHWFIKRMLRGMAIDGVLKIPDFQDDQYRKYNQTKYYPKDPLSDFLLNSYYQDKARKSTKISGEKLHHYFIYTGQEKFVINNDGLKGITASRQKLKLQNKNLYAILKEVWQCENSYIPVCKDANYGFTKGLAQIMNIAKADPKNPQKMICSKTLDKPELDTTDPIKMPTGDHVRKVGTKYAMTQRCMEVIRRSGFGNPDKLKIGVVENRLGNDDKGDEGVENAWWLRKCCAKTAKFSFVRQ